MGKPKKYYVVWKGHQPGIYDSWEACSKQVSGFPGAKYKSFATRTEAASAFSGRSVDYIGARSSSRENAPAGGPIQASVCVDAACDGAPGNLEYRAIDLESGKVLFEQGPFNEGTNNVGEFLAIVHAAALLKEQGSTKPIYSDSRTAISWVRKRHANTKLQRTDENELLFDLIHRAENWLLENDIVNEVLKWETKAWGEIPADYGRK